MTSGFSIFGALGSKSQVLAKCVSVTWNIGGSFSVSTFRQYGFLGAKASPTMLLYSDGGVPVMENSFVSFCANCGKEDKSAHVYGCRGS